MFSRACRVPALTLLLVSCSCSNRCANAKTEVSSALPELTHTEGKLQHVCLPHATEDSVPHTCRRVVVEGRYKAPTDQVALYVKDEPLFRSSTLSKQKGSQTLSAYWAARLRGLSHLALDGEDNVLR